MCLSVQGASLPRRDESFQPDRVSSECSQLAEMMSVIHLQRVGGGDPSFGLYSAAKLIGYLVSLV